MANGILINTGSFTSYTIRDLVSTTVGDYQMPPLQYTEIFKEETSDKSFEMDNLVDNFTVAVAKPAGQATQYTSGQQRYSTFYNHQTFGLGFEVTMEAKQDLKEIDVVTRYTKQLMNASRRNQEYRGANILNRAFNSSYVGGDNVELCSLSHPTAIGNQANTLANQAGLSEASLEDMCILVNNFKDYNGNVANLRTKKLVIPTSQEFEAERILNSVARVATANNDLNAMRARGKFPEGFTVNKYLDSTNRFFILTDAEDGLKHFNRMSPEISQDAAFDTWVDKYKIIFRDSFGWSQWLGAAGCGNF
jgi:hypothetical protein